jgi:hypothetical protein
MNPTVVCRSCGTSLKVRISADGFFESSCHCGSSRSWRVPGYPLPMSFDLLGAEPRWEREPREKSVVVSRSPAYAPEGAPGAEPSEKAEERPKASWSNLDEFVLSWGESDVDELQDLPDHGDDLTNGKQKPQSRSPMPAKPGK